METARGVGARIGAIRKRRGLTQEELAGRIDRSVNTVSAVERGVGKPSFDTLLALASALGVPIRDFFAPGGDGGEASSPEQAALYGELLETLRTLPLPELEMTVEIVGVVARRHGG